MRQFRAIFCLSACCFLSAVGVAPGLSLAADRVLILSAASAASAIEDIAADIASSHGIDVRVSPASSGTLARQISRGAPADIFVSASPSWIERLTSEGRLNPEFTQTIARNRLVLVRPRPTQKTPWLDLTKPLTILDALNGGRLAIGDPAHVPAGAYAQAAFEELGLWAAVRDHLAPQSNVRAVLAMVERGETPLGVVYATDAALSSRVGIAAIVPPESHPPILYTAAVIQGRSSPLTLKVFEALTSDAGRAILERHGFAVAD